jgi:hypothetical protein
MNTRDELFAGLAQAMANPFIPELHKDDCDEPACIRCEPEPLEQQIDAIRAHARAANPDPDGDHWDQWHAFLDIDPDLRGRNYGQTA